MTSPEIRAEHKIAYVDGLRALAVLGVLALHAAATTMDYHGNVLYHVLSEGGHGVDLFFVISGFCLAFPTVSKVKAGAPFSFDAIRYFARRIVRIYPPYIATFLFMLAAGLAVLRIGYEPTVALPVSISDALLQLTLIKPGGYLVGAFWTLPIELHWYLVFPLVLWVWAKCPRPYFVAIMVICAAAYRMLPFAHYIDIAALPCFMMGVLAAEIAISKSVSPALALIFLVASVAASVWLEPKGHLNYIFPDQIWWQVASFALVVAVGATPALRALFSHPWATFIGVCSYSIYLIHQPFTEMYGLYGGKNLFAAFAAGLLPGIIGWMLVERYVTTAPLKQRLVAKVEAVLSFGRVNPRV